MTKTHVEKIVVNPPKIFMIGAGGIVNDAHLPAYKIAGYCVAGIYDINCDKAIATANRFNIPFVFNSLADMLAASAEDSVVFDVALPGSALAEILEQLPCNASVLLQKPMGEDLKGAQKILQISRERKQIAAVNFQLRYAPYVNEARQMINDGLLGNLLDIEVYVNVFTPWNLWTFLEELSRVEILYHSIHYIDLVRSFFGNPTSVYAKTIGHPSMPKLASVRSSIIMDYGDFKRANILTNHCHKFGLQHQDSYIKFEGMLGAIKIKMGALMNYPTGVPDDFEFTIFDEGNENAVWTKKTIKGSWFPEAFIGSMAEVMYAMQHPDVKPDNSVEDCIYTMACVEAAYQSNEIGGVRLTNLI